MSLKRNRKLLVKVVLFFCLIIPIAVLFTGCVQGMTPIGWSGIAINDSGIAFTGTKEGRMASIDLSNNSIRFAEALRSAPVGGFGCAPSTGSSGSACGGSAPAVAIYGTPALANVPVLGELAYIAGYNGKVFAYDAASLQPRWTYPVEGNISPIVSRTVVSGETLYFGGTDHYVYALDIATGALKWRFATQGEVWSSPAVADNMVFIGSFDRNVYALDANNGTKIWEFTTGANIVSTPVFHDGIVYSGSLDRNFYAINAADGREIWRFQAGNWFWAKPIVLDNTIYAACLDNRVYALDAKTGNLIASHDAGGPVASDPVVLNNMIIAATKNERLMGFDITNPASSPRLLANIPKEVTAPLAARGNNVYINSPDNNLYAYDVVTGARFTPISLNYQQ